MAKRMNILNLFCNSFSTSIIIILALTIHSRGILAQHGVIEMRLGTSRSYSVHDYDITKCNPNVREALNGNVYHIGANGNCINIYQGSNCQGRFIRYFGSYSALHSPQSYRWVGDGASLVVVMEPLLLHSVGPCYDRCDPRNWEGAGASQTLALYEQQNFQGSETMVHLNNDDCHVLPPKAIRYWQSLKISGVESSSCVELHSDDSCGGDFTQFRPGYPSLEDLGRWSLGPSRSPAYRAKAVSRCGSSCRKTIPQVKPEPAGSPGPGVVTYYDHSGYYGYAANIKLPEEGCLTLPRNTSQAISSIRTWGQCVTFYELPGCEEETQEGSYTLQPGGKDYEKFLIRTIPPPRSLRLCPSLFHVVDAGIPESEMDGNCVKPEKVEILEKIVADAFPNWIIYVQPFCWLLILVGGALLGSFITKRYEKKSHGVNSEGFNVAYKS